MFGGKKEAVEVLSPVSGQVVPLSEVNDPAFAQEILGKGVAVKPSEGEFRAPISGEVVVLFDTGHAVSIKGDNGAEIIVHIGLDTVQLKGQHFTAHVQVPLTGYTESALLLFYKRSGSSDDHFAEKFPWAVFVQWYTQDH